MSASIQFCAASALLATFTLSAAADEARVEAGDLSELHQRLAVLEDQLALEDSHRHSPQTVGSPVSSMLADTDIHAWAAGSYNYNLEAHHNAATARANRTSSHRATNTFAVDQVWVALDNAATEESRGGAHVDYEWGNVNGAGTAGRLYAAYASYLANLGNGAQIDAGLVPTLIGAEVNQTPQNDNVTRGLVWGLQPVTHLGAIVRVPVTDTWTLALGVLNDPLANPTGVVDGNNEKAVTGQIKFSADTWEATSSVVWGESEPGVDTGLYDIVVRCSVSDTVSTWINYTLRASNDGENDGEIHGLAIGGRKMLSAATGVSLRVETVILDLDARSNEQFSITATTDYAATDHLTVKLEGRIDVDGDDRLRDSDGSRNESTAMMVLGQLVYAF